MKNKFLIFLITLIAFGTFCIIDVAKAEEDEEEDYYSNYQVFNLSKSDQYTVKVVSEGLYLYSDYTNNSSKASNKEIPINTILTVTKEYKQEDFYAAYMIYVTYNGVSGWIYANGECNDDDTICSKVAEEYKETIYVHKNMDVYSSSVLINNAEEILDGSKVSTIGTLEKNKEYNVTYYYYYIGDQYAALYVETNSIKGWIRENYDEYDSIYDEKDTDTLVLARNVTVLYSDINKTKGYNINLKKGQKITYYYNHTTGNGYDDNDDPIILGDYYYVKLSDGTKGWINFPLNSKYTDPAISTVDEEQDSTTKTDDQIIEDEEVIDETTIDETIDEKTKSKESSEGKNNKKYIIYAAIGTSLLIVVVFIIVIIAKKKKAVKTIDNVSVVNNEQVDISNQESNNISISENNIQPEEVATQVTTTNAIEQEPQITENNEQPKE